MGCGGSAQAHQTWVAAGIQAAGARTDANKVDPFDGASPGNTPHDLAKDGDDKKVFVALLSGKDCECLWRQDRTIRQLKEEAQQKLDITIKNLIGPNMELLDEEKVLAEENIEPGTTLTVVVVDQAAEDEKEAKECINHINTAAGRGKLGAVRHLLRTEPPGPIGMNAVGSGGLSALHVAVRSGHVEICRVLLEAKAEVYARCGDFSETPLHMAARYAPYGRRVELVKLLLEAKASVTAEDNEGETPLDNARDKGPDEVVRILKSAA